MNNKILFHALYTIINTCTITALSDNIINNPSLIDIILFISASYLIIFSIITVLSTIVYPNKTFGTLIRLESFWIGIHYSKACKRYCINILPCFTIWFILKDGLCVDTTKM